jgi:hypothetical protein
MNTTQTTTIEAKKDLYNAGKCFTKGKQYEVNKPVKTAAGLMEAQVTNDMNQPHLIGSWWREFEIVENETED